MAGSPLQALERLRGLLPGAVRATRRDCVRQLLEQGWSRYRIAKELGVSRQAVSQWEHTP